MPKPERSICISPSTCLSMVCSAIEVFPKECMGCILGQGDVILAAFPYQKARRKLKEVMSESSAVFDLFKYGKTKKIADYHSHTYQYFEQKERCTPSATDIAQLKIGGIEFIIQIRKKRNKSSYIKCKNGNIHIGCKRYRCTIVAFKRVKGLDEYGILLYDKVGLRLKS